MPGLNEDVLRVTRFLPGTASNALSARSHVRGGRDEELAVYFDGVPLFEPFHYKDVQSLLGLLDPGSISKIDFFSGVFPARYGNRLSGVLDIAPRMFSGRDYNELGASVLYTHALSQGRLDSYPVDGWSAYVAATSMRSPTCSTAMKPSRTFSMRSRASRSIPGRALTRRRHAAAG